MASGRAVYIAKRAATIGNQLSTDAIFVQADNSAKSAFVSMTPEAMVTGTSGMDGKSVYVRASGKVTTGASSTLLVTIYYSPTASASITYNGTGVTTTGATVTTGAIATTSGNWQIEYRFIWDYTSKQVNGIFAVLSSPTPTYGVYAAATQLTSVDLSTPGPGLIVGAHFGTTGANNVVTLSEFVLEVL